MFFIFTNKEEIEGTFDGKTLALEGRRPTPETRIYCKIVSSATKLIYQYENSNDLEQFDIASRFLSQRLRGIKETVEPASSFQ